MPYESTRKLLYFPFLVLTIGKTVIVLIAIMLEDLEATLSASLTYRMVLGMLLAIKIKGLTQLAPGNCNGNNDMQ